MRYLLKGGLIGVISGLIFAIIFVPIFGQLINCMLGMPCEIDYLFQRSLIEILFTFKNPDHIVENWVPWMFIGLFIGLIVAWIIKKMKLRKNLQS